MNSLIEKTSIINRSSIGNYCYIGPNTVLNKVCIGNYCSICPGVQIGGTEHPGWHGSASFRLSNVESPHIETIIEDDVWIAANVVIRQGVRLGRGAVIGACSLVSDDVPVYSMAWGLPAKVKKMRFPEHIRRQVELSHFWLYKPKMAKKILEEIKFPVGGDSSNFL